ncbi:TetR/AcrR family transcriptional regulator [Asanoa siamensis]|uniref:TetR family transcriptional regulator n=1 Tax=Asanoa siamensis TaxID=926357 RepID=A0ABQ4CTS8_9ACTN|nr:TetR/AcrR family transcriptional regulator [Asanoa siamensis]GIF74687.1 TetR family transcriptional regulator [Asanoa siamensis]
MLASVASRPTFKRLPRAVREQQMLDAAVRVFSRRGFHEASMDEIADEAGISKPMVYAYLGSKDDLFRACVNREGTRLLESIVSVVGDDLPADEQLWRGLRGFFAFVGAHRDGWAVLYRQAKSRQPFADDLAALRTRIVAVVAGMLGRAVQAARTSAHEQDLTASAYALVGAAESIADWLADHPEADPDHSAARLMNFSWLGARQLLQGELWQPSSA